MARTASCEMYRLPLHDALPISCSQPPSAKIFAARAGAWLTGGGAEPLSSRRPIMVVTKRRDAVRGAFQEPPRLGRGRSEEHTSELQSPCNLVCRLLLEKKHRTE